MLDYYLESLTSKNLEKTFEEFCRKLAESELCPNLLPQTGPTGGGDSKVDSKTYPVPSDDPIIPKGKENAPITDILRRKT